jgi:ubiquinone/menaquinone biosynthesis C-methylase UbiE
MKYLRSLIPVLFILCLTSACREDSPIRQDQPSLMRDPSPPASTVSEPLPLPKTGAGNFESLVADYESKDRGIWQKPDMVISLLGNLEGKTVADIGAGTGYFTFRLLPKAQKVIGIDIDQRFINFLDSVKVRLPEQYKQRFESRLAKSDNPMLKANEADAVVIVNTYGYIDNRIAYLKTLFTGMSPGARLLIIDFKKNNLPVGPPDEFKVALSQAEKELHTAGFTIAKIDKDALDYQYIIVAQKPQEKK